MRDKDHRQDSQQGKKQGKAAYGPLYTDSSRYQPGCKSAKAHETELHHEDTHHPSPVFILHIVLQQCVTQGHMP